MKICLSQFSKIEGQLLTAPQQSNEWQWKSNHEWRCTSSQQNLVIFLAGGFKNCLFSPLLGEEFQFDEHIFQMGWFNHQLVFHLAMFFYYRTVILIFFNLQLYSESEPAIGWWNIQVKVLKCGWCLVSWRPQNGLVQSEKWDHFHPQARARFVVFLENVVFFLWLFAP